MNRIGKGTETRKRAQLLFQSTGCAINVLRPHFVSDFGVHVPAIHIFRTITKSTIFIYVNTFYLLQNKLEGTVKI